MAEAKHTPGPWAYRDGMILTAGDWIDETGKKRRDFTYPVVIAHVPDSWDQSRNGNLLAAAPDMYEALRTTSANIRSLGPAGALDDVPMPYREWLKVVEDALSKAEGRS